MSEDLMVPRKLLERVKYLCDYWISRGSRSGMSESEYKSWRRLGFGSKAYTELRSMLSEQPQAGDREAECERLRSERDAFRDSRNYLIEEISSHLSEIAELREALRSAEIDAARYRWLRDGCDEKYSPATHIAVNCYGMEWDATIDTAMKGDHQ